MLYLSGAPPNAARLSKYKENNVGVIYTPNMGARPGQIEHINFWAADTGCYSRGNNFDLDNYLRWLDDRKQYADKCLFATAPDVVGNAFATWQRSKDVLPLIRDMGFKAALVAQDGIEGMAIDWRAFDTLFIGGSTDWKLGKHCLALVREAKKQGKRVHIGRVNSFKRFRLMASWGADSADGTYLAFGPDRNLPRLQNWLMDVRWQREMELD